MKTLILYTSNTGNTKAYAEDVAKAVGADVFPLKHFKVKKMLEYDTIVFGGWVRGGTIQGLDDFLSDYKKFQDKNVIIFSVGMSSPTPDGRALLIEQNLLDLYHVRYYQFQGSFDMKKVKFPYNLLMARTLDSMANDPTNPNAASLRGLKDKPILFYDRAKVDRLVSVLNQLSLTSGSKEVDAKEKQ
jgi:menaquinone-dependent protoporphyrinogen IX oxidase